MIVPALFFCIGMYGIFERKEERMAVELKRLIEQVSHMDIQLLSGQNGMHNQVTWVHMVEAREVTDFLDGGEIAFITGIGTNSPKDILSLVKSIFAKDAAGIVINIGPFIEKVPDEVVQYCEEKSLPLFQVPWKVHLAEIMRIFCFAITKEDRKNVETASAFKNAIFFPKQEELYVVPLSQNGFSLFWSYTVCVIIPENTSPNTVSTERAGKIVMTLSNHLCHHYQNFSLFSSDNKILAVTGNYTAEEVRVFVESIMHYLGIIRQNTETFTIGVGKTTKSIRCLFKSYRQAESVCRLQSLGKIEKNHVFYSDMGMYKLLMNIEDRDVLEDYYQYTIQPLVEFDKKNDGNLTQVLQCYLNHNGSVKETADELYVHRNTINYKLTKIRELTGMDLSSVDARVQLAIGLMLQNIL